MKLPCLPQGPPLHLHAEGRTRLALAGAGGLLVAAGADDAHGGLAVVRVDADGTAALKTAGSSADIVYTVSAVAVSHSGAIVAVGSPENDKEVQLRAAGDLAFQATICRTLTPARAIAFSPDDAQIAVGSDDPSVRVVQREDPTSGVYELRVGHSVKALAWDPRGRYLAVYTVEGTVHVFDTEDGERALVRSIDACKTKEGDDPSFSSVEYPLAWHPTGDVLAVGTDVGAQVFARDTWRAVYTLRSPSALPPRDHDKYAGTTVLAWSPNGRYLAAADSRRLLTVWDAAVPATDPVTGAPVVTSLSASTGEPAVAMHGYLRPAGAGGDEAGSSGSTSSDTILLSDLNAKPMGPSHPRPTAAAWMPDGAGLAVIDSDGDVRVVGVGRALAPYGDDEGSPVAPLTEALAWPMTVVQQAPAAAAKPRADDGASASASSAAAAVLAAAAAPAKRLATLVEGTKGAKAAAGAGKSRYGEDEAMEGGSDEDEDADEASPAKAGGAGALDTSVADMKRRFGFEDADEVGEDGLPVGVRSVGDAGAGAGGGRRDRLAVADLLASGRVVTSDALEAHMLTTARFMREVYGLANPQPPFQPGATRYRARTAGGRGLRRFLVWNQHGAVVARADGPTSAEIDVLFTDKSTLRDQHISDAFGFCAAALSDSAVVFASRYQPPRGSGDVADAAADGQPAVLMYKAFAGWGAPAAREWRIELPVSQPRMPWHRFPTRSIDAALGGGSGGGRKKARRSGDDAADGGDAADAAFIASDDEGGGAPAADEEDVDGTQPGDVEELDTSAAAESPVAVALGDGWCAAATDRHFLRFFRSGGSQDPVVALPGAPVTVAGQGALCAVVYHRAPPSAFQQRLGVDVYVVKGAPDGSPSAPAALPRLVKSVDLPLRPHATLNWLGFSSPGGQLLAHDSLGTLLALQPGLGWVWTPLADTKVAAAAAAGAAVNPDGSVRRRDTRDRFWPLAVVNVPASTVQLTAPGGSSSSAAAAASSGGDVPVVRAVFLKGATPEPAASTAQLPLVSSLPLHMPLLDTGSSGAYDDEWLRVELAAQARGWLASVGLSAATGGGSVVLAAAMRAAAASSRGEAADAQADALGALEEARDADRRDVADLDKATIRSMKTALENDRDVRAVQLASRLHLPKSFDVAVRLAGDAFKRGAVAERVAHLRSVAGLLAPGAMGGDGDGAGAWADASAAPALSAAPPAGGRGGREQQQRGSRAVSAGSAGEADADAEPSPSSGSGQQRGFGLGGGGSGISGASSSAGAAARRPSAAGAAALSSYRAGAGGGGGGASSLGSCDAPPAPVNPFGRKPSPPTVGAGAGAGSSDAAATASPGKRKRAAFDALNQMSPQGVTRQGAGGGGGPTLNRQSSISANARAQRMG